MKIHTLLIPILGALFFLSGCQVPVAAPAQSSANTSARRDAEIARIMELKKQGVITDAQAFDIINALVSDAPVSAASMASRPSIPAVAPSVAPVVAPASAPAAAAPAATVAQAAPAVPAVAPVPILDSRYKPAVVLEGRLRSTGSDTMDLVVANWEREFVKYHPGLRIIHEGRGTSTATPALIAGMADVGPMSRFMLEAEAVKFRDRFGYDATQVRVALDALGIYVHPDNPIAKTGLTMAQLDAIFSATRKAGGLDRISTWGQLGLKAEWANAPVQAYGRNRASGTYGYFRDVVLLKGEFGEWVEEQASSANVVGKVEASRFGIGFSGVGYKTSAVALVPLAKEAGKPFVPAVEENALDGSYPLARPLLLAFNRNPASPVSDLHREFVIFALSPIGQEVVKKEGYYPLPSKTLAQELLKLR